MTELTDFQRKVYDPLVEKHRFLLLENTRLKLKNWQKGEPTKEGYYLIAWKPEAPLKQHIIVSEVWFNPDAIYHWWFTRGYLGQRRQYQGLNDAVKQEIVGWMPMPDPPEEVSNKDSVQGD